jgi:hypothetical protein
MFFWDGLKEKLLREVNRLWFPMVIVMDNLSIHAMEEVRQVNPLFFSYSPITIQSNLHFSIEGMDEA